MGEVRGFAVDKEDHQISHVLLEEGHLWGKKQIAIPIGAAKLLDGYVKVDLSKEEIEALPPVELD